MWGKTADFINVPNTVMVSSVWGREKADIGEYRLAVLGYILR